MKQAHVVVAIVLLVLLYGAVWFVLPTRAIDVLVVDKTVPDTHYREHRAIHWFLKHWRYTDASGSFRDYAADYLGYHPTAERGELLEARHLEGVKLLYLADSYGVYDYEKGLIDYERRLPYELQFVNLIYGGITLEEAETISKFASQPGVYLVGEHNVFGFPTHADYRAAEELQDTFGVRYQGWLVRYYESLQDVAFWVKLLYERVYGKELTLTGPGLVVVREDSSRRGWFGDLVVIEQKDLTLEYPVIHSGEHPLLHGAAKKVPYLYWMEFLDVVEGSEVLAYYELPVNEEAAKKLKARGLSTKIPAVVYRRIPNQGTQVYFAGDFADQLPPFLPSAMTGSATLQRLLSYLPGIPPHYQFAFRWYNPVIRNIFKYASPY